MGVCGKYIQEFKNANIASCEDVHMDCPPKHVFFDVVKFSNNKVDLESHWDGAKFTFEIKTDVHGDYASIKQKTMFDDIKNTDGKYYKIRPMLGERI